MALVCLAHITQADIWGVFKHAMTLLNLTIELTSKGSIVVRCRPHRDLGPGLATVGGICDDKPEHTTYSSNISAATPHLLHVMLW